MRYIWFIILSSVSTLSVAAPVQVDFSGSINSRLVGTVPGFYPMVVGTDFVGRFRYDSDSSLASNILSSTLDLGSTHWDITSYLFEGPNYGFDISFSGVNLSYNSVIISIYNTDSTAPDKFSVLASESFPDPAGTGAIFNLVFDTASSLYNNTQLPPSIPDTQNVGTSMSYGETSTGGSQLDYYVVADRNVTAMATPVPLPSALLLFASSLFSLGLTTGKNKTVPKNQSTDQSARLL